METEGLVGDDVDPRLRRRLAAEEPNDIFAAVAGKAAIAIPEVEIACILDGRRRKYRFERLQRHDPSHAGRLALTRRSKRRGTGDLIDDLAVSGMEDDAGDGHQRLVGRRLDQILANREDILPMPFGMADAARILAERLDRVLHILRIGSSPLVEDNEIGNDAARAQIFLGAQALP